MKSIRFFVLFLCAFVFAGCSSVVNSHRQKMPMMTAYINGENKVVESEITDKIDSTSGTGDELMWHLEAGSMNFHLGKFDLSINAFKRAEALVADYDERARISIRDAGAEAGAVLTNMNALPYRGLCRDRIALAFYKSLAYLGGGNESAFRAQIKRLRNEQKKVQDDYKEFFEAEQAAIAAAKKKNPAVAAKNQANFNVETLAGNEKNADLASGLKESREVAHRGYGSFLNPAAIFLSGLSSMWDENYDNARIDFKRLHEAMPESLMMRRYYVYALQKAKRPVPENLRNTKPFEFPVDRDCVFVFFANGRSVALKQIAIYFPLMTAWPMCEFYTAPFKKLTASADNVKYETSVLADMDAVFAQEFSERLPGIVTRIILNTAVKEAAYYTALAFANAIPDATARAIAMVSVATAGTAYRIAVNTADTRSWEILPKEFQLTQFAMPANRTVTLDLDGKGLDTHKVTLPADSRSAVIFVSAPSKNNIKYHVFSLKNR